jgi:hypothetical protein
MDKKGMMTIAKVMRTMISVGKEKKANQMVRTARKKGRGPKKINDSCILLIKYLLIKYFGVY